MESLENAMISIEDCIAMCGLTREEVDAIAEHEHIEEIAAAAPSGDRARDLCCRA